MQNSSLENVKPEQKQSSESSADNITSSPAIANTFVGSCGSPKIRPILFSTDMIKAIIEGRKTQTRRICKAKNGIYCFGKKCCHYGQIDDILWVREKWSLNPFYDEIENDEKYLYAARDIPFEGHKWKPSIHMPYTACRLWLKIVNVRVERLQSITTQDAFTEGVTEADGIGSYIPAFYMLWCKINGQQSWNLNPFVWVIEFERCSKP